MDLPDPVVSPLSYSVEMLSMRFGEPESRADSAPRSSSGDRQTLFVRNKYRYEGTPWCSRGFISDSVSKPPSC